MGATIAELLAAEGKKVTYVTHSTRIGPYMRFTLEEQRQYQRLVELGVEISHQQLVVAFERGQGHDGPALWSGRETSTTSTRSCCAPGATVRVPALRRARSGPDALDEAAIRRLY